MLKADLIIQNANVITMDPERPKASAMAVAGDRILGVGEAADLEMLLGPSTKVWDLEGKFVIPGFNDNHSHPMHFSASLAKADCSGVRSLEELFRRLKEKILVTPEGNWVEGWGYDETLFQEGREPTLEEMDRLAPSHPLYIGRTCAHVGLVNSRAMELAGYGKDRPDPPGGQVIRDGQGHPTGRVVEAAAAKVRDMIPELSADDLSDYIAKMCRIYNSYGITSGTDMGMVGALPYELSVWGLAMEKGNLTVRIAAYLMDNGYNRLKESGIRLPLGNDLFRFAGRKLLLDGSGGGGTAAMREPNTHDGRMGVLLHTQEELDALVLQAHQDGEQISTHAIGDRAIEMILDAYQKAQEKLPRKDARHRIEHCSFCFPDLIRRVARQGVYPLLNPGFLWSFGEAHLRNYGPERLAGEFPFRSLLDQGVMAAIGSDCPVTSPDPRKILYAAITRKSAKGLFCGERERVTAEEALRAYTASGAYFTFDENKKGRLKAGLLADFVVLDQDPCREEPEALLEMKVERTVLGGRTVYEG